MARCESADALQKLIVEGNLLEMESSDSDSVISCSSSKEEENASTSPKNADNSEQVNIGPVLSLQCLHEDSNDEANESLENTAESEFIGVDDVPQLLITEEENLNHEEAELEEHPHLVPVKTAVNNSLHNSALALLLNPESSVPARNNWDGLYNFKVNVKCSNMASKSDNSIFSELLNKLYVAKDNPFKVRISAENVPVGSIIRVTAVFCLVEHSYYTVRRCPTHAQQDFSKGNVAFEHFVQCFSEAAIYEKNDRTGNLSVSIPYEKPQDGETFTRYLFKLTCFNSCTGGINRRPFMLVFTLEKDNIPLGRQTLEAKVCACPMRDFKIDEEKERKKYCKTDIPNKQSSLSVCPEKTSSKYSIAVKDLELYLFLKHMKNLYETTAYSAKIQPNT